MRIIILMLFALLLTNCTNSSYVKNKKSITSPNDLQKFYNIYCDKNKTTDKVIKMCGSAFSKDLMIAESKSIMSAKIKIADIVKDTQILVVVRNKAISLIQEDSNLSKPENSNIKNAYLKLSKASEIWSEIS